jgi:hypothetical protein
MNCQGNPGQLGVLMVVENSGKEWTRTSFNMARWKGHMTRKNKQKQIFVTSLT